MVSLFLQQVRLLVQLELTKTKLGNHPCDDADAGYFVSASAASSQTPCAAGKYQPLGGQSSCTDVEAGYYSPGTTTLNGVVTNLANQQIACSTGTYAAVAGMTCDVADAGYYVSTTAATGQTACPAGTYQPATSQSSCLSADAGYYSLGSQGGLDVVGAAGPATTQVPCAAGTWQNETGKTSCKNAEAGHYSAGTTTFNGAVTNLANQQVECPVGHYQNQAGQVDCLDAQPGFYVDMTGQTFKSDVLQEHTRIWQNRPHKQTDAGYYSTGTTTFNGVLTNTASALRNHVL